MVGDPNEDKGGDGRFFSEQSTGSVKPQNSLACDPQLWRTDRTFPASRSAHACGFALADQGADTRLIQDYLGLRSIQHTVYLYGVKIRQGLKSCGGKSHRGPLFLDYQFLTRLIPFCNQDNHNVFSVCANYCS
jgi:hypothetical protein